MPLQLLFNTHKLNHLSIQEMHDAFISHRNALLRSNKIKSIAFSLFCCHVALLKASHFANTPAYQTITASLDRHLKTLDEFVNREPINNSIENKRLVLEQINYSLKLWHDAFRAATAENPNNDTYAESEARKVCLQISKVVENIQVTLDNRAHSNEISAELPPQSDIMLRESDTENNSLSRRALTASQ
jgi:hypothetical protein